MAAQPTALTQYNTATTIQPAATLDTNFTECGAICLIYAGIAAGSANAIDLTIPLDLDDYFIGMAVKFVAAFNNTGPTSVNINGLGTNINVSDLSGVALTANAIVAGNIYELTLCVDVSNVLTFRITGSVVNSPVSSVFGRTGAVAAQAADYSSYYAGINGDAAEPFDVQSGTTGNEAVNFSQFAATKSATGAQAFPSGVIQKWIVLPSHSQDDGQFTVSFTSAFPTAFYGVIPCTTNSTADTGLDSMIQFVRGDVNGATFIVQAMGGSPTSNHVSGFALAIGS